MRLVVGSELINEFKQAERERHHDALAAFIERAREHGEPPSCTMVLRSAHSGPAQALITMKDAMAEAGLRVRAILAHLEPEEELRRLFATLAALSPNAPANSLIRWARNPRLLDAHEQVTYGADMCWSGDAMRRDADKRNPLVLFERDDPNAALLGRRAFTALWSASVRIPERHLLARGGTKPSGAYEQAQNPPISALRPHIQGWPLVRH